MHQKHLRLLTITLIGLAGAGCASSPGQPSNEASSTPLILCKEPRPEMCTQQYDPVCGKHGEWGFKTYGNACTACSKAAVVGYRPGVCN